MTENATPQKSTIRVVLAQVLVCNGCCCGRVDRGRPEVPVDWLKAEWKKQGLLKRVQLTITACLGPCDIANAVAIVHRAGSIWLGGIKTREEYQALIDWAVLSRDSVRLEPFPPQLAARVVPPPFLPADQAPLP